MHKHIEPSKNIPMDNHISTKTKEMFGGHGSLGATPGIVSAFSNPVFSQLSQRCALGDINEDV